VKPGSDSRLLRVSRTFFDSNNRLFVTASFGLSKASHERHMLRAELETLFFGDFCVIRSRRSFFPLLLAVDRCIGDSPNEARNSSVRLTRKRTNKRILIGRISRRKSVSKHSKASFFQCHPSSCGARDLSRSTRLCVVSTQNKKSFFFLPIHPTGTAYMSH
jgi:hypothetical protein